MAQENQEINSLQILKEAIKNKTLGRLYFFHGQETFLLQHYRSRIQKLLVDEITESFNFHKLTVENFSLTAFADRVESLPMMAEHTFIWVDEIDIFALSEDDTEKLVEVFSDIPEYCTVVFTYETTQWKPDTRKKLYKVIEANGLIVEFPKQEQRDLIAWAGRHFAANQKQISSELCAYLIDITGGTMTALSGEIAKICAYSGADTITKSDIDAVVEPVLDAVVFQMTDLMGQGNYGAALIKLQELLKMQNDPLSILGAVGTHFRRLSVCRTLRDNGQTAAQLHSIYPKMSDYAARKNMSASAKFSPAFFERAAQLILQTDIQMKTSYADAQRLLELLVLQLSGEERND